MAEVSGEKKKKMRLMKEIVELINKSKTIIISSTKGIPCLQLQKIRRKLKKDAIVKIAKKNVIMKALESSSKKEASQLKDYVKENSAVLFSDVDAFELASILAENKISVKAKSGQEATDEISIEAGPTDMPAGPMITELSAAGIKIAIEGGKIAVKEKSILAKKGEKISEEVANILGKMEVLPFSAGLEPLAIFSEGRIYIGVRIDKKEAEEEIGRALSHALSLAINVNYYCKDTMPLLLVKANAQANALTQQLLKSNLNIEEKGG